jgi:hypothetical protein
MREMLQKAKSFITFDFPLDRDYISEQFATTHNFYQKEIPQWSTNATRRKVIASYWFVHVLKHFAFLFGVPATIFILVLSRSDAPVLSIAFVDAIITFVVILLFHYGPNFYSNFLPKLETIKEVYEQRQLEQLEKCKRAQLSNPALVLIYYVFDKLSGTNSLQCNDNYAQLLMKLYGVDQGSIKKNLELILGKKKNLSERKHTEISNRFQEAHSFLEEIQCKQGIQVLNELEQKFMQR